MQVLAHSANQKIKKRRQLSMESPLGLASQAFTGDTYKPAILDVPHINDDATTLEDLDEKVIRYARDGIDALVRSTRAFYGLGDPATKRLIITNAWGTAHA